MNFIKSEDIRRRQNLPLKDVKSISHKEIEEFLNSASDDTYLIQKVKH